MQYAGVDRCNSPKADYRATAWQDKKIHPLLRQWQVAMK
jgi:hypothetical protein